MEPIKLGALNVLIGPNGSGKSNLIEAICFLRSSPKSVKDFLRRGGGVREWIWKGQGNETSDLSAAVAYPLVPPSLLHHVLKFTSDNQILRLRDERIERLSGTTRNPPPCYTYNNGMASIRISGVWPTYAKQAVDADASILSQRQDPDQYPEITYLASQYRLIRVYRDWSFGHASSIRDPQKADSRSEPLDEDFSNLGLFLNSLRRNAKAKRAIQEALTDLYPGIRDFDISVIGGYVQLFFEEQNDVTIPATRLSDGTLRYLCLLAILLDPTPPPLICIEEPELGLHPDIIPKIADLLVHASQTTQLVVTTHSDILIDALSGQPESVLVCERNDGATRVARLDPKDLEKWLGKYKLGQLWMRGEIGGTRW
jgi:predicted ATPase